MTILFLCTGTNPSRSIIARSVMKSLDRDLDVYASCREPVLEINKTAVEVLADLGLKIELRDFTELDKLIDIKFDYLITISDGTHGEHVELGLEYDRKLHLSFYDPEKVVGDDYSKRRAYKHLVEDIKNELDYFYNRILKVKDLKNE